MGLFSELESSPFSHSCCHFMSPVTRVQPRDRRVPKALALLVGTEPMQEPY